MRFVTLVLSTIVLTAASSPGAGIRYDQVPADVTGYAHADFDRLVSSRWLQQMGNAKEALASPDAVLGQHPDMTLCTMKSNASESYIILWHTRDPDFRKRVEAVIADPRRPVSVRSGNDEITATTLTVTYRDQEIHFTSESLLRLWGESNSSSMLPGGAKAPAGNSEAPTRNSSSKLSIGLGLGSGTGLIDPGKGPSYTAFIGQDLIVVAGDLPSIAREIDVIQGKRPSLAQQDPQGLKIDAPPGVMFLGAGLTAAISKDNPKDGDNHTTGRDAKPDKPDDFASRGFGLNLFGSVKAMARLGQFDLGEDDKQIYVDGMFTMKDAESTEQLKNLVVGVKALIGLTQQQAKPLLEPLQVQAADKHVLLRWSWPLTRLTELSQVMQTLGDHEHSQPATAPATSPSH
jgi:hypothetical protein